MTKLSEPIYEALQEQWQQGELKHFVVGQWLADLNDYNLAKLFAGADGVLRGYRGTGERQLLEEQVIDIAGVVFKVEANTPFPRRGSKDFWHCVSVFSVLVMLEHCRRQGLAELSQEPRMTNQMMRVRWLPSSEGSALRQFIIDHIVKTSQVVVKAAMNEDKWMSELVGMIAKKQYLPKYSLSVYLSLVSDENLDEMVEASKTAVRQLKDRENGNTPKPLVDTLRLAAMTNLLLLMERGERIDHDIHSVIHTGKLARFCTALMLEWLARKKQLTFTNGVTLDGGMFMVAMTQPAKDFLEQNLTSFKLKCLDFSIENEKRT